MIAYFDSETGALKAVSNMAPPAGTIGKVVDPNGDLVRRMSTDITRFRLRLSDGKIEELTGWEVADTRADDLWAAMQSVEAKFVEMMAGSYIIDDRTSVPYAASATLERLHTIANDMVGAGFGDLPAWSYGDSTLTWKQIVDHAVPYKVAIGGIVSWREQRLAEIKATLSN